MKIQKKVKLKLVGLDGNAFCLLGAFKCRAEKEGWTEEAIEEVMATAMSGDYANLVTTLAEYCVDPSGADDVKDEDDN